VDNFRLFEMTVAEMKEVREDLRSNRKKRGAEKRRQMIRAIDMWIRKKK
jgi:hypothetical protein